VSINCPKIGAWDRKRSPLEKGTSQSILPPARWPAHHGGRPGKGGKEVQRLGAQNEHLRASRGIHFAHEVFQLRHRCRWCCYNQRVRCSFCPNKRMASTGERFPDRILNVITVSVAQNEASFCQVPHMQQCSEIRRHCFRILLLLASPRYGRWSGFCDFMVSTLDSISQCVSHRAIPRGEVLLFMPLYRSFPRLRHERHKDANNYNREQSHE
jgi:hypothetical protein